LIIRKYLKNEVIGSVSRAMSSELFLFTSTSNACSRNDEMEKSFGPIHTGERNNMNCRGEKRRIQIANDYIVKPIAYLRLLNGQKKRSDAEANLTDKYYIFECVLKSNPNITEKIICGNGAGAHFLRLINQESPLIFDPLKTSG